MDRKSLLAGMTLGAAIAFGGMILGGLGQPAAQPAGGQPAAPNAGAPGANPGARQPKVDWFDKLSVRQIDFVNSRGKTVMELAQAEDGASIQIYNGAQQELVRIGNVLRGGGQIMTFQNGQKLVELTSIGTGGAIKIAAQDKDEWIQLTDGKDGPKILGGSPQNWIIEIPPGAAGPPPAAPANPNAGTPGAANPNGGVPVNPNKAAPPSAAPASPSTAPGAPKQE